MTHADLKLNIDDTISPTHTRGATAKSVAGNLTPNARGDKAPATMYERFFGVRSTCYGRSGRPIRGAASFCAVVRSCSVGLPLNLTRARLKAKAKGLYAMDNTATGAPAPDSIDHLDRIQTLIAESQTACELIGHAAQYDKDISLNALDLLLGAISSRLDAIHAETQMMASGLPHNASAINGGAV